MHAGWHPIVVETFSQPRLLHLSDAVYSRGGRRIHLFASAANTHAAQLKGSGLNEILIQQVLGIENRAREVYEAASREAEQLPIEAEKEAQALIEQARAEAQEQARQMMAKAHSENKHVGILAQAEESVQSTEGLARSNFDRAVLYIVRRVIGRE
jgi:vacuolar-type H+-ATPase subunit H